jgi:hypothetical protein
MALIKNKKGDPKAAFPIRMDLNAIRLMPLSHHVHAARSARLTR